MVWFLKKINNQNIRNIIRNKYYFYSNTTIPTTNTINTTTTTTTNTNNNNEKKNKIKEQLQYLSNWNKNIKFHSLKKNNNNNNNNNSLNSNIITNNLEDINKILKYFYGLKDSNNYIIKNISNKLVNFIINNGIYVTSSYDISITFKSFSTINGNSKEIQNLHYNLLKNIPLTINSSSSSSSSSSNLLSPIPFPLPINTIIDIYSSMTHMPSQCDNFNFLLQTMLPHLQLQHQYLTYEQCSNILYSFQSSTDYSDHLSETIKLLCNRLDQLSNHSSSSINRNYMTISQISKCMYGIKHFSNDIPELKLIYQILSNHLVENKLKPINIQDIHHIICTLHAPNMNFYRHEIKVIITTLCELIEYNYVDLTPSVISSPSIDLLTTKTELQSTSDPITVYSYGPYLKDIFSSFINQSSDVQVTQNLLISLNFILLKRDINNNNNTTTTNNNDKKIKPMPRYYLTPKQLAQCLYSMKFLSSRHIGVSEVIESLSLYLIKSMNDPLNNDKILEPTSEYLTGKEVSHYLQGMSFMSDEDAAGKKLLLAVYNKLQYFDDIQFTISDICLSLNGFRGMTSKYVKITQIVDILIEKYFQIKNNNDNNNNNNNNNENKFTENDLSLAFTGLRQITPSSKLPKLVNFMQELVDRSIEIVDQMSFKSLQLILTNLTHIIYNYLTIPETFIELLLINLKKKYNFEEINNTDSNNQTQNQTQNEHNKLILLQSLHLLKHQTYNSEHSFYTNSNNNSNNNNNNNNNNSQQSLLPEHIVSHIDDLINMLSIQVPEKELTNIESKYDNKIFTQLEHVLRNQKNIELTKYEIINGFSTDIMLKVNSTKYLNPLLYNFEIDGPIHNIPTKQLYFKRRDLYFYDTLKIEVIRLPLVECGYLSKMNLNNYLKKIIQEKIKCLRV